jgi:hypothetical protein
LVSHFEVYMYSRYTRRKIMLCHYLSKWHFVLQKLIVNNNVFNLHWLHSTKSNNFYYF